MYGRTLPVQLLEEGLGTLTRITLSLDDYTQPPLHSAYGLQFHGSHVNMVRVCRVICNIDSFAIGIMAH